jgi:hypothetical protein
LAPPAFIDAGSFDYAADAWGYSTGGAAELYAGGWTARAGLFNLSKVPNGQTLETGFSQFQTDFEEIGEVYYELSAKPFHLSLDYQLVRHPAYNRDRGPAHLVALRLHESL